MGKRREEESEKEDKKVKTKKEKKNDRKPLIGLRQKLLSLSASTHSDDKVANWIEAALKLLPHSNTEVLQLQKSLLELSYDKEAEIKVHDDRTIGNALTQLLVHGLIDISPRLVRFIDEGQLMETARAIISRANVSNSCDEAAGRFLVSRPFAYLGFLSEHSGKLGSRFVHVIRSSLGETETSVIIDRLREWLSILLVTPCGEHAKSPFSINGVVGLVSKILNAKEGCLQLVGGDKFGESVKNLETILKGGLVGFRQSQRSLGFVYGASCLADVVNSYNQTSSISDWSIYSLDF